MGKITSFVCFAFFLITVASLQADEPKPQEKIPTQTMKLKILAPDGSPVEGAKVRPDGLRTKLERGSHYFWMPERFGQPPKLVSDEKGEVELEYPQYVVEKMETGEVTVTVDHPSYVVYREDQPTTAKQNTVKLQEGYRLRIFAVTKDPGLKPVKSSLHGLIYDRSSRSQFEWEQEEQGTFLSPALEIEDSVGWVVRVSEKPILFSDLLEISPEVAANDISEQRRVVLLKPGWNLSGSISENVPRPVKNGRVLVFVVPTNRPHENGSLTWSATAEITPEGTFTVPDLPRESAVQVIALCDGWINQHPTAEEFSLLDQGDHKFNFSQDQLNSMTYAQVVPLSESQEPCVIPMEQTRTVKFQVVTPDETPLQDANVALWPNQRIAGWGSTVVGAVYPTAEVLTVEDRTAYFMDMKTYPFSAITDAKGFASVAELPQETSIGYTANHEAYAVPVDQSNPLRRSRSLDTTEADIPVVVIKMEPLGTTVLGAKKKQEEE